MIEIIVINIANKSKQKSFTSFKKLNKLFLCSNKVAVYIEKCVPEKNNKHKNVI